MSIPIPWEFLRENGKREFPFSILQTSTFLVFRLSMLLITADRVDNLLTASEQKRPITALINVSGACGTSNIDRISIVSIANTAYFINYDRSTYVGTRYRPVWFAGVHYF